MKRTIGSVALMGTVLASAGIGGIPAAYAEESAPAAPATPAAPAEPAAPTAVPYGMQTAEAIGLKPATDDLRLNFYGWVEQSYTYSHESPHDRINVGRVFDVRSNDYALNQVTANFERTLSEGKDFDIGGKVELLYGADGRFIHSTGLADNISGDRDDPIHGNTLNFDPTVFYVNARLPVGNGLTVKVGKYVTAIGYEVLDAPGNALFSHSFLFGFAEPLTHTGVQFDYPLTDKIGVYFGIVTGWDDWFNRNGSPSYMAGGSWKVSDKLTAYLNLITGPERDHESGDYRSLMDFVATYQATDTLLLGVNVDFGNESGTGVGDARDNNWWGVAGYLNYVILPSQLNANVRCEYFADGTASRVGFTADLFEVTAGLDVHPIKSWQNLRVRPEVRYDHAFGDHPFDAGTDQDQFTVGADLILTF